MIARLAVAAVLLLGACSRQEPKPAPQTPPFQRFVEGLGGSPACADVIPMEWSPSLPVPVLVDRSLHYRIFFRGWEGNPKTGIKIRDAEGDALFSADGKIVECRQRAERGRLFPDEKTEPADYESRMRELYTAIEETGRLYARAAPVLGADRNRLKSFSAEFAALTPPGHAGAYRALNPDFWSWLVKNEGSSP